jgi:hypothetical protein
MSIMPSYTMTPKRTVRPGMWCRTAASSSAKHAFLVALVVGALGLLWESPVLASLTSLGVVYWGLLIRAF